MPLIGFDADQDVSRVAPAAVAAGVRIFCRYLKNLTAHEILAIFGASKSAGVKVGVLPIWETGAQRALEGETAGHADGIAARAMATRLGFPDTAPLCATADFDATAEQQADVLAYLSAFKQGTGTMQYGGAPKLGVYANGAICQAAKAAGIAEYAWVAGGSGMRGTRAFIASGLADLIQDVGDQRGLNLGIAIDSDYAPTAADPEQVGCWCGDASQPVQPSPPAPVATGEALPADAKVLQTFLRSSGLYSGPIDGIVGPQTQAAVGAYYRR